MSTSIYLYLFHGRKTTTEDVEGWGEEGPTFGPLKYAHTTYANRIHLHGENGEEMGDLHIVEDGLVYYDGMYYGDWSVCCLSEDELNQNERLGRPFAIVPFDEAKAIPESVCDACKGRGWLVIENGDTQSMEVQRCDMCGCYDSDDTARAAVAEQSVPEQRIILLKTIDVTSERETWRAMLSDGRVREVTIELE